MKLETAKRKFKGDWLAFQFTDESKEEGKVLLHTKSRHRLHKKLNSGKIPKGLYITFAGPLLPKGYSIVL